MSLDRRYLVAPIHKSLQLLDALSAESGGMSLSDLAACTGLPKTTAFRYLYTLRASGFVRYDEHTGHYAIGSRVAISQPLSNYLEQVKELVQPVLHRLHRQFNETVNLGYRDGVEFIYVDMVGSTRLTHAQARIGTRDPLHCTAIGKAILMTLDRSELDSTLPRRMIARTTHTIINRKLFLEEISQSATRRYALDLEENELGARCVAAAIGAHGSGGALAAISISGPLQVMSNETLSRMGQALAATARTIDLENMKYLPA